jgi:alkaline phosphatase D
MSHYSQTSPWGTQLDRRRFLSATGGFAAFAMMSPLLLSENPHIKFVNTQRGYIVCDVTSRRWRTDYRTVPYVTTEGAPITTRASFVVEAGDEGIQQV